MPGNWRKRGGKTAAEMQREDRERGAQAKRGRGRPPKEINWDLAAAYANMGATRYEIAAALGVSLKTLERPRNRKIFDAIRSGGVYRANLSIRRVLFGTLRGRLVDPSGETIIVPLEERIAMAKYLANRRSFVMLEEAHASALTDSAQERLGRVVVVRVGSRPTTLDRLLAARRAAATADSNVVSSNRNSHAGGGKCS